LRRHAVKTLRACFGACQCHIGDGACDATVCGY
jgi:hypothetical protein